MEKEGKFEKEGIGCCGEDGNIGYIRELKHVIYMMRERGELGFFFKGWGRVW